MVKSEKFTCKECSRMYSSASSLCNHTVKKHKNKISSNDNQMLSFDGCHVVIMNNKCKKCHKILADRHSRWRHEQKCINEIILTNTQSQNITLMQNTNIQNQNIGTLNNGTINITVNNYNEDNIKYISDKFMTNILDRLSKKDDDSLKGAIPHLIENIKFNPSHKENNNVKITNIKSKIAKRFIDNRWEHIEKDKVIKDMHTTAISVLHNWINENKDVITDKIMEGVKDYKNISEEYIFILQEINLLGYTYFKNHMENELDN